MAEVGASGSTGGWSDRVNDWLPVVHRMIAAANKVPEGAPVGTIARRPDGAWLAYRGANPTTGDRWFYFQLIIEDETWPQDDDADSWPVIYDPTDNPSREELREYFHKDLAEHCQADDSDEYHEGDKPRLERLMREPSVFDPETGMHWFEPGEEPTVPRPDPTADEVEDLAKWLSIHIGTWPEDEWELRSKPNYYHDRARELLDFGYRKVSDPTAQQEPGVSDPRSTSSYGLSRNEPVAPKPPRTPRVRDRLGVDEQGARWLDSDGGQVLFNTDQWMRLRPDGTVGWFGVDYEPTETAPYVELIEPRVLPSLDCEEARDGTVWEARYVLLVGREQTPGWKFQHTQDGWVYEDGSRVLSPEFLTGRGPYTEVLGDPS
ncbi:Hypothetical protein ERS075608_01354 [Mycobacteroides abscessus]|nr:Hypothetical protein ERS075608_01354 [Mycobacteroides abscessus]